MVFPAIKRANIHSVPEGKKWELKGMDLIEWAYDDTLTQERRSRAVWARHIVFEYLNGICEELMAVEEGHWSWSGEAGRREIGNLRKELNLIAKELLLEAGKDEK